MVSSKILYSTRWLPWIEVRTIKALPNARSCPVHLQDMYWSSKKMSPWPIHTSTSEGFRPSGFQRQQSSAQVKPLLCMYFGWGLPNSSRNSGSRHQGSLARRGKRSLEEVDALLVLLHRAAAHGSIRSSSQVVLETSVVPQMQDANCSTVSLSSLKGDFQMLPCGKTQKQFMLYGYMCFHPYYIKTEQSTW